MNRRRNPPEKLEDLHAYLDRLLDSVAAKTSSADTSVCVTRVFVLVAIVNAVDLWMRRQMALLGGNGVRGKF